MRFKLCDTSRSRTVLLPAGTTSFAFRLSTPVETPREGDPGPRYSLRLHREPARPEREGVGAGQGHTGDRETCAPAPHTRFAMEPSAPGPWSWFPDLAPGTRGGQVPACISCNRCKKKGESGNLLICFFFVT